MKTGNTAVLEWDEWRRLWVDPAEPQLSPASLTDNADLTSVAFSEPSAGSSSKPCAIHEEEKDANQRTEGLRLKKKDWWWIRHAA